MASNGPDYFWWSGGWNDKARVEGQHKLLQWIHAHCGAAPDVFAHSHDGNLSMLASWHQPMRQLVLLACPVHWRLFSPRFANIVERVLPCWFAGHGRPRQSSVWKKHGLDKFVQERLSRSCRVLRTSMARWQGVVISAPTREENGVTYDAGQNNAVGSA